MKKKDIIMLDAMDAADKYLSKHRRTRFFPRGVRGKTIEVWAYYKFQEGLEGEELEEMIKETMAEESTIPPWVWQLLIGLVVQVIIKVLEKWWENRNAQHKVV